MRTLRLARVAAEAEGLLLRRKLRRIAISAVLVAVALFFVMGAVAMLHVAFWLRMSPDWGPGRTALALAGFDVVVAAIAVLFAVRTPSDRIMTDATVVRDQAIAEIRNVFTLPSLAKPLMGIFLEQWLFRRRRKKE